MHIKHYIIFVLTRYFSFVFCATFVSLTSQTDYMMKNIYQLPSRNIYFVMFQFVTPSEWKCYYKKKHLGSINY
jgi:hypothetical protein